MAYGRSRADRPAGDPLPFLTSPGGGHLARADPALVVARADIAAVQSQPTSEGRRLGLGPSLADGSVLLTYGDYTVNTGPIDVISVSPAGVVTTLLADLPTERIDHYRVGLDGSIWAPSVDPVGDAPGFLVTNAGDTWHSVEIQPEGQPVAVHVFDTVDLPGVRYACGSRHLDEFAQDEGMAVIWKTTDGGATWTEDLAYEGSGADNFNRFYSFGKSGDDLFVATSDGDGYFALVDGAWTHFEEPNFNAYEYEALWGGTSFVVDSTTAYVSAGDGLLTGVDVGVSGFVLAGYPGDRYIYITAEGMLVDTETGERGALDLPMDAWSASLAPDGSIWLCDGDAIYLLPPPA